MISAVVVCVPRPWNSSFSKHVLSQSSSTGSNNNDPERKVCLWRLKTSLITIFKKGGIVLRHLTFLCQNNMIIISEGNDNDEAVIQIFVFLLRGIYLKARAPWFTTWQVSIPKQPTTPRLHLKGRLTTWWQTNCQSQPWVISPELILPSQNRSITLLWLMRFTCEAAQRLISNGSKVFVAHESLYGTV